MDVPAPGAGRITQVMLKQGDKASEGSLILLIEPVSDAVAAQAAAPAQATGAAPSRDGSTPATVAPAAPVPAAAPSAGRAGPRRVARRRGDRRIGVLKGLCQSVGAQVRARAGCRSRPDQGNRSQGPHYARRRQGSCEGHFDGAPGRSRAGFAAAQGARRGLCTVRRHRSQAAVANPANIRNPAPGQLDQSAACDPARGRGYHGTRSRAGCVEGKGRARRGAAHPAGLHRQGKARGARCRNFHASIRRWIPTAKI